MTIRICIVLIAFLVPAIAFSDQTTAYCEIYSTDRYTLTESSSCTFSQYQGHIYIVFPNKKTLSLTPDTYTAGNYMDQYGNKAYRKKGLSKRGQIYQLKNTIVYVYWGIPEVTQIKNTPKIMTPTTITKPISNRNVYLKIIGNNLRFNGVMKLQGSGIFTALDATYLIMLNVNTGRIIIFDRKTGKLIYNYYITPITTFENPDTMCNNKTEQC